MSFLEYAQQISEGTHPFQPNHPATLTSTRIVVDPTAKLHPDEPVSPLIYSGFIEHLGRCIYGGITDDPSNPSPERLLIPQEKGRLGWRKDVMKLFGEGELEIPMVRWPGGNFVSNYHWTDAIGPVEKRKKRLELAWRTSESNLFGTDEFIDWCRATKIEPFICFNMGTGTLEEALAWVEYCNGTEDTEWVDRRRKNTGREEPHQVKYWGLGNEVWGPWQVGNEKQEAYSKRCKQWAQALRRLDPDIILISCGNTGIGDWDRQVLMENVGLVDYHSIHRYTVHEADTQPRLNGLDYEVNVFGPAAAELSITTCKSLIDMANVERSFMGIPPKDVRICFDEWGIIDDRRCDMYHGHQQVYNFEDALGFVAWLNVLVRKSYECPLACLAQSVNVIAPIITRPDGLVKQTVYYPLSLFGRFMKNGYLLSLSPTPDNYTGPTWPYWIQQMNLLPKYVDMAAIVVEDGDESSIRLSVLNRHPSADWEADLVFSGFAINQVTIHEMYNDDLSVANTMDEPQQVVPAVQKLSAPEWASKSRQFTVRKHSWCFFIFDGVRQT